MDITYDLHFPSLLYEVVGSITPHAHYQAGIADGTVNEDWAWGTFRSQLALMGHMHDEEEARNDPLWVEEGSYRFIEQPDSDRLLEMQFGVSPNTILGRYFPMVGQGAANALDILGTYTLDAIDIFIPDAKVSGKRSTEGMAVGVGDDIPSDELRALLATHLQRMASPYTDGFVALQTAGEALLTGVNNILWEEDEIDIPDWPRAVTAHVDVLPLIAKKFESTEFLNDAKEKHWAPARFVGATPLPSTEIPWLPNVLDWNEPIPEIAYRLTFVIPEWSLPVASWMGGMVATVAGIFGVHSALMRITQADRTT